MYYRAVGFDSACQRCRLSCGEAIPGQARAPLSEVKLVIISAYPGSEEVKQKATLVPAQDSKFMNAGAYLQQTISQVFDSDPEIPNECKPFDRYVFKTNAIKCPNTGKDAKLTDTAIKACKSWLSLELNQLPKGVPILLAASQALTSMTLDLQGSYGVNNNRGNVLYINNHPCLGTNNPIEALRYTPYEGNQQVPPVLGSIPWQFNQDLNLIKTLVKRFITDGH